MIQYSKTGKLSQQKSYLFVIFICGDEVPYESKYGKCEDREYEINAHLISPISL